MEETINIKCPICGAILTVKNMVGIETKNIPCPICKTITIFEDYKKIAPKCVNVDEGAKTEYNETYNLDNNAIGKLKLLDSNIQYDLRLGENIVGRKANSSVADVQIETNDMTMSRSHSLIEVVKNASGEYKYIFTNANNKNATYINNEKVDEYDKIFLSGGEKIRMGGVILVFSIKGN